MNKSTNSRCLQRVQPSKIKPNQTKPNHQIPGTDILELTKLTIPASKSSKDQKYFDDVQIEDTSLKVEIEAQRKHK